MQIMGSAVYSVLYMAIVHRSTNVCPENPLKNENQNGTSASAMFL